MGFKGFKLKRGLFEVETRSYVREEDIKDNLLDCSLGTNPYGFPKEVLEEISLEDFDFSRYPSPHATALKEALVEYWENAFNEEEVFIGTGSMGCLEKINKFLVEPYSRFLGYSPQFPEYITQVRIMGGIYDHMNLKKEDKFQFNPDEFLNRIDGRYTSIYLDNPNNPTGQIIPLDVIEDVVESALKHNVIVIVDEAYGEFMDIKNSAINMDYPNLIVVRSFSKGFGLANLRIGYAVIKGKELRGAYSKVDLPFQISTLGEILAIKAMQHRKFIEKSISQISKNKKNLLKYLQRKGFCASATSKGVPIVLLWKENIDLYHYMLQRKILTVSGETFVGLGTSYVRVRIPAEIKTFIKMLEGS